MDKETLKTLVEEFIPFNRFLGSQCDDEPDDDGSVRVSVPFRPEFIGDPMRPALHGGVISTLADLAGGMAVWRGLEDARLRVATIDLRIDYLRPGRAETLDARAHVVRQGNRVAVVDIIVFHPSTEEDIVATGKGVYNIVMPRQDA
jgi:uncharacterized protein (TIGR00369 family)